MLGVGAISPSTVENHPKEVHVVNGLLTRMIPPLPTELFERIFKTEIEMGGVRVAVQELWNSIQQIDSGASLTVKGSYAYSLLSIEWLETLFRDLQGFQTAKESIESRLVKPPRDLDLFIHLSVPSENTLNDAAESIAALIEKRCGCKIAVNLCSYKSRDKVSSVFLPGVDFTFIASQRRPLGIVTHGSMEIDVLTGEFKEGSWQALIDWLFKLIRPCHPGIYDPYDLSKIASLLLRGYRVVNWEFVKEARGSMKELSPLFEHLAEKHLTNDEDRSIALMQLLAITGFQELPKVQPPGRFAPLFKLHLEREVIEGFIQLSAWWEQLVQLPEKNSGSIAKLFRSNRLSEELLELLIQREPKGRVIRNKDLAESIKNSLLSPLVKSYLLRKMCDEECEIDTLFKEMEKSAFSNVEERIAEWIGLDLRLQPRMRRIVLCLNLPNSFSYLKRFNPFSAEELRVISESSLSLALRLIRELNLNFYLSEIMMQALADADCTFELVELVKFEKYQLSRDEELMLASNCHFFLLAPHFFYADGKAACRRMMLDQHFESITEETLWKIWEVAGKDREEAEFIPLRRSLLNRSKSIPTEKRLMLARSLPRDETMLPVLVEALKAGILTYSALNEGEIQLFSAKDQAHLRTRRAKEMLENRCFSDAAYETAQIATSLPKPLLACWEEALHTQVPVDALSWVDRFSSSQPLLIYRFFNSPESRALIYTEIDPVSSELAQSVVEAALKQKSPPKDWLLKRGSALISQINEALAIQLLSLSARQNLTIALTEEVVNHLLSWVSRHPSRTNSPLLLDAHSPLLNGEKQLLAKARASVYLVHPEDSLLIELIDSREWTSVASEVLSHVDRHLKKIGESTERRMKVAAAALHVAEEVSESLFIFTAKALPEQPEALFNLWIKRGRKKNPHSVTLSSLLVSLGLSIQRPLTAEEFALVILHAKKINTPPYKRIVERLLNFEQVQFAFFSEVLIYSGGVEEKLLHQLLQKVVQTSDINTLSAEGLATFLKSISSIERDDLLTLAEGLLAAEPSDLQCSSLLHLTQHSFCYTDRELLNKREALFSRALAIRSKLYEFEIEKIHSEMLNDSETHERGRVYQSAAPLLCSELVELFNTTFLQIIRTAGESKALNCYAQDPNLTLFSPSVLKELFIKLLQLKSPHTTQSFIAYLETTANTLDLHKEPHVLFESVPKFYLENLREADFLEIAKTLSNKVYYLTIRSSPAQNQGFVSGLIFSLMESFDPRSNQKILYLLQNIEESALAEKMGLKQSTLFFSLWALFYHRKWFEIWRLAKEGIEIVKSLNLILVKTSIDRDNSCLSMPKVVNLVQKMSTISAGYVLASQITEISNYISAPIVVEQPIPIRRKLQRLEQLFKKITPPIEQSVPTMMTVEIMDSSCNLMLYPQLQERFIYALIEIAVYEDQTRPIELLISKVFQDTSIFGPMTLKWIFDSLVLITDIARENVSYRTSLPFLSLLLQMSDCFASLLSRESNSIEFSLRSAMRVSIILLTYISNWHDLEPRLSAISRAMVRLEAEKEMVYLSYLSTTDLRDFTSISKEGFLLAVRQLFSVRSPHGIGRGLVTIGLNQRLLNEHFPSLTSGLKEVINGSFINAQQYPGMGVEEAYESIAANMQDESLRLRFLEGLLLLTEMETGEAMKPFVPHFLLYAFEMLYPSLLDSSREIFHLYLDRFKKILLSPQLISQESALPVLLNRIVILYRGMVVPSIESPLSLHGKDPARASPCQVADAEGI